MTAEVFHLRDTRKFGQYVAAEVRGEAAKRRVTGARLAFAVGMTPMSMSRRMTGSHPFSVDELHDVCAALGLSMPDLLRAAEITSVAGLPHLDSNQEPADYQTLTRDTTRRDRHLSSVPTHGDHPEDANTDSDDKENVA